MPSRAENVGGKVLRATLPAIVAIGSISINANRPPTVGKRRIEYIATANRSTPQQLGAIGTNSFFLFHNKVAPEADNSGRKLGLLLPVTATLESPPSLTLPSPNSVPNNVGVAINMDTPMWRCIRLSESGNQYNNPEKPSGAYGILLPTWRDWLPQHGFTQATNYPTPASAPPALQDAAAQFLYAENGNHYAGTWNDPCTGRG